MKRIHLTRSNSYSHDYEPEKFSLPITFNINDGYVPIIRLNIVYGRKHAPFFTDISYAPYKSVKRLIEMSRERSMSFTVPQFSSYNNSEVPRFTSAYMSIFLMKGLPKYLIDNINDHYDQNYYLTNDIDVLILGLHKMSQIKDIDIRANRSDYVTCKLNPEHIKLLVSDKLMDNKWMKANYSNTIQKHIINHLAAMVNEYNLSTELVSDEEMSKFVKNKTVIKTSSLMDIMQIGDDIKDKIFTKEKLEKSLIV
jgi:hypothetical protein